MDAHNLAIIFGPSLVRTNKNTNKDAMVAMARELSDQCRVVESIILHVSIAHYAHILTLYYCRQ